MVSALDAAGRLPDAGAARTVQPSPGQSAGGALDACAEGGADEELMLRYRDGDAAAFDRLYERHRAGLYRFILRQCRHRAEADEVFQDVIRVNLESYFRLSRAAMKGMMKRRSGRIIGITSVVGVTGNPGQTNYAASKAGMIGFSKSLAQEVGSRGITVNCIAPGFIASPMTDVLNDTQRETILKGIPAGRLGTGDEIAAAAVYLSSDEAAYVTGQTLHVNGGMAMV